MAAKSKYMPEFNDLVIEMGKQGMSLTQIASKLGVSRAALRKWENDEDRYPGFGDAMKIAMTHAECFWENIGLQGVTGELKKFQQVAWIFTMKARFGKRWQDQSKQEITINKKDLSELSEKELNEKVRQLLDKEKKEDESDTSGEDSAS